MQEMTSISPNRVKNLAVDDNTSFEAIASRNMATEISEQSVVQPGKASNTSLLYWLHRSRFLKMTLETSDLSKSSSFVVDPMQISFGHLCDMARHVFKQQGPFLFMYKTNSSSPSNAKPLENESEGAKSGTNASISSFVPLVICDDFDLDALLQHCIRNNLQRVRLSVLACNSSIIQQHLPSNVSHHTKNRLRPRSDATEPVSRALSPEWELVEHGVKPVPIPSRSSSTSNVVHVLLTSATEFTETAVIPGNDNDDADIDSRLCKAGGSQRVRRRERLTLQLPLQPITASNTDQDSKRSKRHSSPPSLHRRRTQIPVVQPHQQQSAHAQPKKFRSFILGHPLFSQLEHYTHAGRMFTVMPSINSTVSLPPLTGEEYAQFFDSAGVLAQPLELRRAIFLRGTAPEVRRSAWRHLLNIYPLCDDFREADRHTYLKRKCDHYWQLCNAWRTSSRVDNVDVRSILQQIIRDVTRTDQDHEFFSCTRSGHSTGSQSASSNTNPRCFFNMNEVLLFHYFFSAPADENAAAQKKSRAKTVPNSKAAGNSSTPSAESSSTIDLLQWVAPNFVANRRAEQHLRSLFNILGTYALCHPSKVTYCQGMSDLAAALLYVYNGDEPLTYLCFCSLMHRRWRDFTEQGLTQEVKFDHLRRLLLYFDPELYKALTSLPDNHMVFFFAYRWLLLEFKREFSFNESLNVLETIWASLAPHANGPDGVELVEPGSWVEQEVEQARKQSESLEYGFRAVVQRGHSRTSTRHHKSTTSRPNSGAASNTGLGRVESYEQLDLERVGFVREIYRRRSHLSGAASTTVNRSSAQKVMPTKFGEKTSRASPRALSDAVPSASVQASPIPSHIAVEKPTTSADTTDAAALPSAVDNTDSPQPTSDNSSAQSVKIILHSTSTSLCSSPSLMEGEPHMADDCLMPPDDDELPTTSLKTDKLLLFDAAKDETDSNADNNDENATNADTIRELLPSPDDLGEGNPFVLLLSLAIIMSHKSELLRCESSCHVAMYFGELSRTHPPGHVQYYMHAARKLFAFYLRVFALKELEQSTLSIW